jgi:DNA-binding CsgD family transcriptional regulator
MTESGMTERDPLAAALPDLIRSLGHPSFAEAWLKTVNAVTEVDHVSLFSFDTGFRPKLMGGAARSGPVIAIDLGKMYIRHFYLWDPNLKAMRKAGDSPKSPMFVHLRAQDIQDASYRSQIYQEHGLIERVSWLGRADMTWFIANIYREKKSGRFSEPELSALERATDVLCAAVERHVSLVSPAALEPGSNPPIEWLEKLVTDLGSGLTPREVEVCARAVSGMTRAGIALDLGVKPTTVVTLVQRAYARLNISTLNELFGLCLGSLSQQTGTD